MNTNGDTSTQYAYLGGGCFWCLEAVYERIPGVRSVVSGYAGGTVENPTYEEVCTGSTGHAEVVRVEFDPGAISYEEILDRFWKSHDPTTLNRQGADAGTQYRSVILYENDDRRAAAEASIRALRESHAYRHDIVTQVVPLERFYPAEEYHQHYFARHPDAAYCRIVIQPKVAKLNTELQGAH